MSLPFIIYYGDDHQLGTNLLLLERETTPCPIVAVACKETKAHLFNLQVSPYLPSFAILNLDIGDHGFITPWGPGIAGYSLYSTIASLD